MTPAQYADFLLRLFERDKWYTLDSAARVLRLAECEVAADKIIGAARRAGWVIDRKETQEFCFGGFCWLPIQKERRAAA
ncbi:hypothetical protein [Hymenobacter cavernae]|uniref:Winged helix-turn-helix domain-containing protein n=1 Tax=Hymenobacter cavernae TaxID=2044852 RepID=A0ABQ1UPT4_9BACT|nr:hypothetical protein [Hymenobacter cavernae]GGF22470.1 hypothetical protein GCM10011383_37630 [Hymenobacter cavernae]